MKRNKILIAVPAGDAVVCSNYPSCLKKGRKLSRNLCLTEFFLHGNGKEMQEERELCIKIVM